MAPQENKKDIPLIEISKHNKPEDLWVIIEDKVYDLTKFRHEHPGGEEVLDEVAGKNATKEFEDVGHSTEAKKMMEKYCIGNLAENDRQGPLSKKEIGLAVGALILGFTVAYLIKRFAFK